MGRGNYAVVKWELVRWGCSGVGCIVFESMGRGPHSQAVKAGPGDGKGRRGG